MPFVSILLILICKTSNEVPSFFKDSFDRNLFIFYRINHLKSIFFFLGISYNLRNYSSGCFIQHLNEINHSIWIRKFIYYNNFITLSSIIVSYIYYYIQRLRELWPN